MTSPTTLDQEHLITVCAVLRNDRDILTAFVEGVSAVLMDHYAYFEILLVDNHSSDDTAQQIIALQDDIPNLRLIRLSQVYSSETALTAGLDNSIGDYVVVIEPRYDDPALVPQLVNKAISGYDIVVVRQISEDRYGFVDRWFGQLAFGIASRLMGRPIDIQESRYRVYSRRVVNALAQVRRKRRYLKYINSLIGYQQTVMDAPTPADRPARKPVQRLESLSLVVDLVVSNSATPLRLTSLIGLFASFLSLLYILYIIIVTIVRDSIVEGWLTTNIVMTVMFFLLFLVLTILSEYIARILDETKDEPLYFIEEETASKVAPYTRLKEQLDQTNVVDY